MSFFDIVTFSGFLITVLLTAFLAGSYGFLHGVFVGWRDSREYHSKMGRKDD